MTIEELQTKLLGTNVNEHTEKKNGLTYLTWSWAWAEALKADPTANYEIVTFDGVPYKETSLGLMCYTKITMMGVTRSMWLPVMDARNNAMKAEDYKDQRGYTIKAATMFDVNKTIMRCFVKNLAMFGLGLYIYSGEDLPDELTEEPNKPIKKNFSNGATLSEISETVTDMGRTYIDDVKEAIDRLPMDKVKAWADWFERKFQHHWKQATETEADYFIKKIDEFIKSNKQGA